MIILYFESSTHWDTQRPLGGPNLRALEPCVGQKRLGDVKADLVLSDLAPRVSGPSPTVPKTIEVLRLRPAVLADIAILAVVVYHAGQSWTV